MLSLVLGSGITDASVAAIASSFTKLELLDLSGYVSLPCTDISIAANMNMLICFRGKMFSLIFKICLK